MATKQWINYPAGSLENVIEDNANSTINSSYVIGLSVNLGATQVNADGTTRAVKKTEVLQAVEAIKEYILRDSGSDFG